MPQFQDVINTNILSHYLHDGWWDNTDDHRPVLKAIMKRGQIEMGVTGTQLSWNVRVKKHSVDTYSEAEMIEITRKHQNINCTLPWALLSANDAITNEELRMSASNRDVLYSRRDQMVKKLAEDFEDEINSKFLNSDYNATSNDVAGFVSFFGDSNAAGAGDKEETASDSYAGHSTALNGITAVSGAESDAWTPTLVNYSSTAWAASGTTWRDNCLDSLTYGKDQVTFGNREKDSPDLVIVTKSMLSDMKSKILESARIITVDGLQSPSGLGFKGAVVHDGLEVLADADQPADVAYLINTRQLFLHVVADPGATAGAPSARSAQKEGKMFEIASDFDIRTNSHVFRMDMMAQLRTSPRHHCKLAAYA